MKTKTVIDLLGITTSLYAISQNKEVMELINKVAAKGKETISHLVEEVDEDHEGREMLQSFLLKAFEVKQELEKKIEETAVNIYKKMNIAHTDQIKELKENISTLEKKISILEGRIAPLENKG